MTPGIIRPGIIKSGHLVLPAICLLLGSLGITGNVSAGTTPDGARTAETQAANAIKPPFGIRPYAIGKAPDFKLQDIDGEDFRLSDSRGRWVFLHFWASWCGPCREEMPTLGELADTMRDRNFEIVMVNTAEDEDTIFEFLGSIDVDLNSLMDSDGQVTEVWKPRGLPTTFLIDPQGYVRYQAIGGREWNNKTYIDFLKQLTAH